MSVNGGGTMRRRRLRSIALLPLVALTAPVLLGLGTSGGRDVIHPAVDFQATLIDKDGTKVDVSRLNIGGEVQLEGDMGRGNLRITFDNIQSVDFGTDSHDYSKATVHLKTGD